MPWLVDGARVDWARWEMAEGDGKPQPRGVWGPSIEDARLLGTTGRDVDEEEPRIGRFRSPPLCARKDV